MSLRLMMPTMWPLSSTGTFFRWFSDSTRHTSVRFECTLTQMGLAAPISLARICMTFASFSS